MTSAGHPPESRMYLALDHDRVRDDCTDATLTDSPELLKFYRAWPIAKLGDF